jgi:mRNA interferase HigB
MHVISRKKLREFWADDPRAEPPLSAWFRFVEKVIWRSFAEVKATFNTTDRVNQLTVFDVGGNKYRLIAYIDYSNQCVFVRHVLTHQDYDKGQWRTDTFGTEKHPSKGKKKGGQRWRSRR